MLHSLREQMHLGSAVWMVEIIQAVWMDVLIVACLMDVERATLLCYMLYGFYGLYITIQSTTLIPLMCCWTELPR